jgi:uncharacterized protein with PIN domain
MNDAPRFLCDEMLGRLCRYLRAAGYDALLANNGRIAICCNSATTKVAIS